MSRDETLHAEQLVEQLLHDVRRAVKPTRADAARNFAGVEARLGLGLGSTPPARASGEPPASAPRADGALLQSSLSGLGGRAGARAAGVAGHGVQLAAKGALVVAFGLVTGFGGYLLGRADTEAHREPIVLDGVPSTPTLPMVALPTITLPTVTPPVSTAEAEATALQGEGSTAAGPSTRARRSPRPVLPPVARVVSASAREHDTHRAHTEASLLQPASRAHSDGKQHPDLHEALELLGRAEAAVRRSDGLEARLWLSDLDRRVARDVLLEERLVTATLASCALGDAQGAQQTLRELTQANPESMYRARLEGSCVGDFVASSDSKVSPPTH